MSKSKKTQEHVPDTNKLIRSTRICHKQLVNFNTLANCDCREYDCSIFDDKRGQCGEYTNIQALAKLAKLSCNEDELVTLAGAYIIGIHNLEKGNIKKTAARLGIARSTFYRRAAALGIEEQLGITKRV